ncbi:MAG: DNA sulfur modification protein DndD [Gemmatimonadota bacterium]|nr:DNA sulfur modification protein DndD [Gemmatimonadota bacterium]
MIFTELELHNFGVYLGRHRISLSPAPGRPIILFGGLNGSGKTTLLEAILLALYGKRTITAKRDGLAYHDYLRRSIHHSIPADAGASVRLQFTLRVAGEVQTIRVSRTWRESAAGIREALDVHEGPPGEERLNQQLSARWDEHVDNVVPLGVAPLFFFDADRIEGFADLANSGDLVRTAVHGLLGLDLVDRLSTDLDILERRKLATSVKNGQDDSLQIADSAVQSAEAELSAACDTIGRLKERAQDVMNRADEVEQRFKREGGELFAKREELESSLRQYREAASTIEDDMRVNAAGVAPLLLVRHLLKEIQAEDVSDRQREASSVLLSVLELRDEAVVGFVEQTAPRETELAAAVAGFLDLDRSERRRDARNAPVFGLSAQARGKLKALLDHELDEARVTIATQRAALADLHDRIADTESTIRGIPDEDAIRPLLNERTSVASARTDIERQLAQAREERDYVNRQLEVAKRRWSVAKKRVIDQHWHDRTAKRVVKFSSRARERLAVFRQQILVRNLARIERLVLESFQQLLRKSGMVHELTIDPDSLAVRLYGTEGQSLHADRLSAGERQLLAVSLLWGLARASRRAIPTIVDTPLGRLDSVHREYLVTRYFPYASHQVLLLSTDEEIGGHHLDHLYDRIGRAYHLRYDDDSAATQIETGYFCESALG